MEPPQPFTARRPAASSLPTFQLPPPDPKYPPYTSTAPNTQHSILTPPVSAADAVAAAGNGLPPYGQQMGYWPPVAGAVPFYAFSNPAAGQGQGGGQGQAQSPGQQQQQQQQNQQPPIYNRALYAPPSNYPPRPQSSDESIPSHHQQQYSMSLPYPSTSSSSDQQQPVQQQPPQQQHDAYGPRPPPTPTYTFPPTTAHSFPSYTQPSPPPARLSPTTTTGAGAGAGPYRPFPYALPTLSGAVMSNVHSPGSQLSLLSATTQPGHAIVQHQQHHSMQGSYPLYPSHGVPHGVAHGGLQYGVGVGGVGGGMQLGLDRPFKCDQCPQSFNRNHDLKRHKRIHLAVKPYPCGECEKSFSRKDALKRHVLVKGCGKPSRPTSTSHHQSSSISTQQRRYNNVDVKTEGPLSSDAESPGGGRGSDE